MNSLIVIMGPTGVGKTRLSVELAKHLDAEIINGDSMQVYRGLDIGTAKIKEEEKEGIPHHLFDICEVGDFYTVYDYQRDCRREIEEIRKRGKRVILVGGTGLYLRAALYDYQFASGTKEENYEEMTNEELLATLKKYDPNVTIHVNNRKRLVRALNKQELGQFSSTEVPTLLYDATFIGLTTDRKELYERIDQRVDEMIEEGLTLEAKKYYDASIRSKALLSGIGYKELYEYFDGVISLEDAILKIKQNSRHYAKRQYTFFRHQFPIQWYEVDFKNFEATITKVLKDLS